MHYRHTLSISYLKDLSALEILAHAEYSMALNLLLRFLRQFIHIFYIKVGWFCNHSKNWGCLVLIFSLSLKTVKLSRSHILEFELFFERLFSWIWYFWIADDSFLSCESSCSFFVLLCFFHLLRILLWTENIPSIEGVNKQLWKGKQFFRVFLDFTNLISSLLLHSKLYRRPAKGTRLRINFFANRLLKPALSFSNRLK